MDKQQNVEKSESGVEIYREMIRRMVNKIDNIDSLKIIFADAQSKFLYEAKQ